MSTNPAATQLEKRIAAEPAALGTSPESLVRDSFDDIALVIGGATAPYHIDDDLLWTVMKRLDRIRVRLLRDLKGLAPCDGFQADPVKQTRVHAAVEEFLSRNRGRAGE